MSKMDHKTKPMTTPALDSALRTLDLEAAGLRALHASLAAEMAEPFERAVSVIGAATGRVIVTGIGKSGHICRKMAATLASTGAPSSSCIQAKPATATSA